MKIEKMRGYIRGAVMEIPIMSRVAILASLRSRFIDNNLDSRLPSTLRWHPSVKESHAVSHAHTDLHSPRKGYVTFTSVFKENAMEL